MRSEQIEVWVFIYIIDRAEGSSWPPPPMVTVRTVHPVLPFMCTSVPGAIVSPDSLFPKD